MVESVHIYIVHCIALYSTYDIITVFQHSLVTVMSILDHFTMTIDLSLTLTE